MRIPLLLVAFALASGCATAGGPDRTASFASDQDVQLAVYNVGFGAVVGAIGAAVNGDRGTVWERAGRGAATGAAGGAGLYAGKWLAGQIAVSESYAWGLPATLVHEAGASVVENTALGEPALSRLSAHLGPVRLDVRPASGAVQARLLPLNALALVLLAADGHRFYPGRSLLYGAPVFFGDGPARNPLFYGDRQWGGVVALGSVYVDGLDSYGIAAHELVHVMQHREFLRTGALFHPIDNALSRSPAYRTAGDWVYLENVSVQAAAFFVVQGGAQFDGCYYSNWFEFEADAFGRRRRIPC